MGAAQRLAGAPTVHGLHTVLMRGPGNAVAQLHGLAANAPAMSSQPCFVQKRIALFTLSHGTMFTEVSLKDVYLWEAILGLTALSSSLRSTMPELIGFPGMSPLLLVKSTVQVQKVRSGVRALPPRSSEGAIPLAGRLDGRVWIVLGLGARGLVYHAWLGKLLSQAILAGDDALLPEELLRWRTGTKA